MSIGLKQKELAKWQTENFGTGSTDRTEYCALGMAEEVGELCHYVLKRKQKIREGAKSDCKSQIADAVADTVIYGIQLMTCEGLNAEEIIKNTLSKVLSRKWNKAPSERK